MRVDFRRLAKCIKFRNVTRGYNSMGDSEDCIKAEVGSRGSAPERDSRERHEVDTRR